MATPRLCSIPDCGKRVKGYGWCETHYRRWKIHGDPFPILRAPRGVPLKFLDDHVAHTDEVNCLTWPFARQGWSGRALVFYEGRNRPASRIMCIKAHGEPPTPKHHAAHSCGKGTDACVNPRHLSWKTAAENNRDKVGHGTNNGAVGSLNAWAKLCDADVACIRDKYLTSGTTQTQLSREYGVSQSLISLVVRGKSWAHVV